MLINYIQFNIYDVNNIYDFYNSVKNQCASSHSFSPHNGTLVFIIVHFKLLSSIRKSINLKRALVKRWENFSKSSKENEIANIKVNECIICRSAKICVDQSERKRENVEKNME